MKHVTHKAFSIRSRAMLLATLAALIATIACSQQETKQAVSSPVPATATVKPVALSTVVPVATQAAPPEAKPRKYNPEKGGSFVSRDYGVSFEYPWQYAFLSARRIANGDDSLKPKPDGHDGQFTLARVEIPQGFYPDTDFESGYFILSLNQTLDTDACLATLGPVKDSKLATASIGGEDFHWIEVSSGGKGETETVRNYVAFENGTCYEVEIGVKTANQDGLAREIDPQQVMTRLDSILQSVSIAPEEEKPAAPVVDSSASSPATDLTQ